MEQCNISCPRGEPSSPYLRMVMKPRILCFFSVLWFLDTLIIIWEYDRICRDVLKSEKVRPLGGCVEVFLIYPYTNNDHETTGRAPACQKPLPFSREDSWF